MRGRAGWMVRSGWLALTVSLVASGCESRVRATREQQGAEQRPSKLLETCSSTSMCEEPLRCVEGQCRQPTTLVQADYYVAVGRRARASGRNPEALAAYRKAAAVYLEAEREVPLALACELGVILASGQDRELGEAAAAELRRCVREIPVGSALRDNALAALARLADVGFDPVHLSADEAPQSFLTAAPKVPPADKLSLEVTVDKSRTDKTFRELEALLGSPDARKALTPCWTEHFQATRLTSVQIRLPYRYRFRLDEFEDFDRAILESFEGEAPSSPAVATATQCAREALAPLVDKLARTQSRYQSERRWSAVFTIDLGG